MGKTEEDIENMLRSRGVKFIAYFIQYRNEGINFSFHDEHRISTNLKMDQETPDGNIQYVEYSPNTEIEYSKIERFYSMRWNEDKEFYTYNDTIEYNRFIEAEITKLDDLLSDLNLNTKEDFKLLVSD